jgi:hypothetical protein
MTDERGPIRQNSGNLEEFQAAIGELTDLTAMVVCEEDLAESLTGQFHKRFSERFDLMIKGKGLNELKKYRLQLIRRGIAAGEIPDETFLDIIFFA